MNAIELELEGLVVLEPRVLADERGAFFESYNDALFTELTGYRRPFVQDNHSISHAGVLRGLHYQLEPGAQGKLVRVLQGSIFDVAVDLRPQSDTLGQWAGVTLSAENHKQLWIPPGFAHGFLALSDCEVLYKADAYYQPSLERSIRWDDADIGIAWPLFGDPLLSGKDAAALPLRVALIPADPKLVGELDRQ
ncbi:dTDP-4-dehydrorhamnose 3,5-epimerase [Devosia epidermidihirudinis]|uniref:dTDP-4-dehydrorhamnose 3,5-epimerase n=1 Tax=Devosia epidermidihirudinis TaxID=1293439 RepID=A0A0F5QDN6_9HYPH|nr:dTDP-4-dehydrorhamnose 3,5-epimerase [Devosia epidermidihirudinis]KKC38838.1 dTDP-4-dehydrorhamnose 3,5-epimerase [Devosia epidermidihirudinis]